MSDLYDTCVFIDYWKGDSSAVSLIDAARNNLGSAFYSALSAMELWQYPSLSRREEIEYIALTSFFLTEAPLNKTDAIKAGQWLRSYRRHARMRLAADALIAATAENGGHRLITRNIKDLQRFYSDVHSY
jgi:predicted nucleic acid-binding protein